jgi:hypothetical protein
MLRVQLRSKVSDERMHERRGTAVTEQDVSILLNGDCAVYRPDGQPLCILLRGGIRPDELEMAYEPLRSIHRSKDGQLLQSKVTDNRGSYGGGKMQKGIVRRDGRVSLQTRTVDSEGYFTGVHSSVIGFYPRYPRIPFCRQTAFTANEVERWNAVQPMIQRVASLFQEHLPERYEKQAAIAARTTQTFIIEGTPFTTLTVNDNVVASIHQDKLDFKEGFGVISVIRRGSYKGHWLVFPQYCVGADLQDGDVIFFNSHDWHGNTERTDESPDAERISVVYYYRTDMAACLSLEDELKRAQDHGAAKWKSQTGLR